MHTITIIIYFRLFSFWGNLLRARTVKREPKSVCLEQAQNTIGDRGKDRCKFALFKANFLGMVSTLVTRDFKPKLKHLCEYYSLHLPLPSLAVPLALSCVLHSTLSLSCFSNPSLQQQRQIMPSSFAKTYFRILINHTYNR